MSRTFFASELEGVATYWRIYRTDGCTLGFVSHDRDLVADDILHRAAPGILPASLRKTDTLGGDSAEMRGPLGHWSISDADLEQGRFDHATVEVGALDWETGEALALFSGTLGAVSRDGGTFVAELQSAKAMLDVDPVPRTSPSCRARFCGDGCTLSAARFTHRARITQVDAAKGMVRTDIAAPQRFVHGELRWLSGAAAGLKTQIRSIDDGWIRLPGTIRADRLETGMPVTLREGCDHRIATCSGRFGNAVNFQGEPFLPGNDHLSRYAVPG